MSKCWRSQLWILWEILAFLCTCVPTVQVSNCIIIYTIPQYDYSEQWIFVYMCCRRQILSCNLFWSENLQLTDLLTKRRKDNANWLHQSKQNITGSPLLQEYPTLTTFFAGEIISRKRPFLTRKWDADEDVDRKHWVSLFIHNLHRCFTAVCFTMT